MSLDGRLLAGVTVFSTVIEFGSFARAGEALGISASGVSHAIARLETRIGVRLIERTRDVSDRRRPPLFAYDRRSKRSLMPPLTRQSPRSRYAAG